MSLKENAVNSIFLTGGNRENRVFISVPSVLSCSK